MAAAGAVAAIGPAFLLAAFARAEGCIPVRLSGPADLGRAPRGAPFDCALIEADAGELAIVGAPGSRGRIRPRPFAEWNRGTASPVVAISDGVWPGIRISDEAAATPSSEPWIDSNTWMVRSVRAWCGSRPIWLTHPAPEGAGEADYLRALADAAVAGGNWAPPLEAVLRWPSLARWAQFFSEQTWRAEFAPTAALAIVQDSAGQDPLVPGEYLNLIARRGVPYRVIERPHLNLATVVAASALLWACLTPPGPPEHEILKAFAGRGGALIAVSEAPDPAQFAREMLDRVGYDNLPVRVFNAPSVISYAVEAQDGRRLIHLVNYAAFPAEGVRVRVSGRFRRATLLCPDQAPRGLAVRIAGAKSEVSNLNIPVYAGVLWEGDHHALRQSDLPPPMAGRRGAGRSAGAARRPSACRRPGVAEPVPQL